MQDRVKSYTIYFQTKEQAERFQLLYSDYKGICREVVVKNRYRKMVDMCKWRCVIQCSRAQWECVKKDLKLRSEDVMYSYSHGMFMKGWVFVDEGILQRTRYIF